ncbi:hypothetical protein PV08_09756 [Exophiala spinifera]|uniref:AMP-dependent synthetase/ligase domain-containing protein n=1 Tax=Exophiala spinifera TaxID=91928 RepID=A0A0D2BMX9_9EURO|nr:uncharacterized protein PV08_09756 [Exophiala spinifera]KIW12479.1 hypothetical protein PV08_09756 [Exophiala spinifera]
MATESPIVPHHGDARWSLPADFQSQSRIRSLSSHSQSKSKPQLDISIPELPLFVQARSHALADPHKAAIIDTARDQSFTYSELLNDVAIFKAQIEQFLPPSPPVGEESRVAFLTPSGYDYVVMQWAIWASGAISVPLCTSHPLKELQYTISDSSPSLIILHPSFARFETGLREQAPTTPLITITPFSQSPSSRSTFLPKFTSAFSLSRRALIIYTSGTTSRPKGCVSTHETITFQAQSLVDAWKYTCQDHLLHVLPLHHVHGIINGLTATLLAGGTVEMHPKFDPSVVWTRWSERGTSTMFMAVPTVYSRLIDHFDSKIRGTQLEAGARQGANALRLVVSGSAALPVSTKRKFEEITGHELLERYGMTEIGMALSCGLERERRIDGSVGWPLPGVKVRLTSETGRVITSSGKDEAGNIEIQGPNLFAEYFNREKATAESFTEDGWFKTGDVAKRDADGAYFILGRESVDLIKSGGYKISALEVERKILGNEVLGGIVREVVVVGVEDAEWGQRVAAVVTLRDTTKAPINLKTFRGYLKEDMAPYKIPSILKIVDSIDRNAMGKVNKKQVLKQYFEPAQ